ncbi:LprI domain-containing protein [Vibrio chagasii]|uniref:lysozyme inhibitor LprI family protein n=1 Tax=Vibrio chagasii TaxID=170679 RepID=UPI003370053B|nr:LprI domain-containing protein [Vibrio chagasii]CAH7190021.1 LprI domain-containing protein [Vibrio chagasii]
MNRLIPMLILMCFSYSVLAGENVVDCDNAMNTLEINHCAALELESAQVELEKYLAASFEHNADDTELVGGIKVAQESWQAYMTAHCDSVYTQWRDGSIRGLMALSCKTKLTKQRTHEVWENFLTYMDSTPPVLPEPELME